MKNTSNVHGNEFGPNNIEQALKLSTAENVQIARTQNEMERSMVMSKAHDYSGEIEVELDKIRTDKNIRVRVDYDQAITDKYAKLIEDGHKFPPVILFNDGSSLWLADGYYRLEATRLCKKATINAIIKAGGLRDAWLLSIESNKSHGAPMTSKDKRNAISTVLKDVQFSNLSKRKIARLCGCDEGTVRNYIKEIQIANAEIPQEEYQKDSSLVSKSADMNIESLLNAPRQLPRLKSLSSAERTELPSIIEELKGKVMDDAFRAIRRKRKIEDKEQKLEERRRKARESGFDDNFVCGDCVNELNRLETGSVRLLLADGPYGVNLSNNYRVGSSLSEKIANDESLESAVKAHQWMFRAIDKAMMPDSHLVLFCDKHHEPRFREIAEKAGYNFFDSIIWDKGDNGRPILDQNHRCHERILWYTRGNPESISISDVLRFPRSNRDKNIPLNSHPTPKPLELIKKLIESTTVHGELVVDPFAGIGTTLTAAKILERRYFGIEINPKWHAEGQRYLQEIVPEMPTALDTYQDNDLGSLA